MAAGRTSGFWADIFSQRRIYPDLNALMVCRREGNIVGVGDDPQGSLERERAYCARVHHIYRNMADGNFVRSLPESAFGSPLVFEHDGIARSANFWINTATSSRVVDFVRQYGKSGHLRTLEIGPGWGMCAYQLHHAVEIESYTLVDLPENLYISTLHLGTVLPDRPIQFVDVVGGELASVVPRAIHACLPGAIGRIRAQYDLVINSFSMQEMDLESVREYIDWIESVLSPEGIFVSLNSHAKAGVAKPSDYRYEKFHIHHWNVFRPVPSGFHNTIPYEVVLGRRRVDSPDYPTECQDGLGWLMQVGLDKNVENLATALVQGTLRPEQRETLKNYNEFFASRTDGERLQKLEQLGQLDWSPVLPFMTALLLLVQGKESQAIELFDQAIEVGLKGFALIRAEILRAALARKAGRRRELSARHIIDPAFAYPEVSKMLEDGDLSQAIVHINRAFGRGSSGAVSRSLAS